MFKTTRERKRDKRSANQRQSTLKYLSRDRLRACGGDKASEARLLANYAAEPHIYGETAKA